MRKCRGNRAKMLQLMTDIPQEVATGQVRPIRPSSGYTISHFWFTATWQHAIISSHFPDLEINVFG